MELEENQIKNNLYNGYDGGWVYGWSIQSTVSMSTLHVSVFIIFISSSIAVFILCERVCGTLCVPCGIPAQK